MSQSAIRQQRLNNQQISASRFDAPAELVRWMIAMQAQEFAHAKWAIGLRLSQITKDADVEKVFNDGGILRTHVMRPTWHFVSAADIRWLLALTAPRVHALNGFSYRKLELTPAVRNRCTNIIVSALQGCKHLTRTNLLQALTKKKIVADGLRLAYIMMNAELEGIICSGPRHGKQFTYALLDERVPPIKPYDRDEALSGFTSRYFASRGPATIHDFANWSGLTLKEVKEGVALVKNELHPETINGKEYYVTPDNGAIKHPEGRGTFLMPDYDEYGMSYKDRSALATSKNTNATKDESLIFGHWIVVNGVIEGTWNQEIKKSSIAITSSFFKSLPKSKHAEVTRAFRRYCSFFGKELEHTF